MAQAPHRTHNLYRSAVTLAVLQACYQRTRGLIDDYLTDVEALGAFPPDLLGPEHRPLRKKRLKDSMRRLRDVNGERLMIAIVDPVNGDREWVWIRNDTLEEKHYAWLIDTKLMQAHREIYAVNRLIEQGSQRYPALNGRVFEIQQRRLPPSA